METELVNDRQGEGDSRGIERSGSMTAASFGESTGAYVQNLPHMPGEYGDRDVAGMDATWAVGTAAGRAAARAAKSTARVGRA